MAKTTRHSEKKAIAKKKTASKRAPKKRVGKKKSSKAASAQKPAAAAQPEKRPSQEAASKKAASKKAASKKAASKKVASTKVASKNAANLFDYRRARRDGNPGDPTPLEAPFVGVAFEGEPGKPGAIWVFDEDQSVMAIVPIHSRKQAIADVDARYPGLSILGPFPFDLK